MRRPTIILVCLFVLGTFFASAAAFDRVREEAANRLMSRALKLFQQGKKEEGLAIMRQVKERYPNTSSMLLVSFFLGAEAKAAGAPQPTRHGWAREQIKNICGALKAYYRDTGAWPTEKQGLAALLAVPAGVEGWKGPYMEGKEPPRDPWGNHFAYYRPGAKGEFDVSSRGADGVMGGAGEDADVHSWEVEGCKAP